MQPLHEILSGTVLSELWERGYTVVPRLRDPFELPAELIPGGWSYQWNAEKGKDWFSVLHQDHPGIFAPIGASGPVEVGGLFLQRKSKDKVDNTPEHSRKRSQQQLEAWADRFGMFVGGATILQTRGEEVVRTEITAGGGIETKIETLERPQTKTVELVSKLPKDMIEHVDAIFTERDRLVEEMTDQVNGRQYLHTYSDDPDRQKMLDEFYDAMQADKGAPWWPTLHAIILPYAIEAVRQQLKEKTP
jgi:hypothetical protein